MREVAGMGGPGRILWRVVPFLFLAGCLGDNTIILPPIPEVQYQLIQAGSFHTCGITTTGQATCWGANSAGQLGVGDFQPRYQPEMVRQGTVAFAQIATGGLHTCALTGLGVAFCWGANQLGQLGLGLEGFPLVEPARVATSLVFDTVVTGDGHSCGIATSGLLYCWGAAEDGQLGNDISGSLEFRAFPDSVHSTLIFAAVTAGGAHTCALAVGGGAYCWGRGRDGQLGIGSQEGREIPEAVVGGLTFVQIDAGGSHTCAVTAAGEGYCWGKNDVGQLGTGSGDARIESPAPVAGGLTFRAISAGGNHTCGVTTTDDVYCWGLNDAGQLGDGTFQNRPQPTRIAGSVTKFASVVAGAGLQSTVSCGMARDGLAYCWGDGRGGQLGTGEFQPIPTPARVRGQPSQ